MRTKLLFIASLFMLGACSNDAEKDLKSSAETINNAALNISIKRNGDMLVFNSDEEFQNIISKLNARPTKKEETSTKSAYDLNTYGDMLQTPDINFKKDGFYSLYDYFTDAMNEAESYYDRPGGYEEFKTKYSMLYFPEEGDDYSAYLPVKDERIAKLLNANGEVSINGKVLNLNDITSYQQLLELGIAATEENSITPTTRAEDYPLNELPEVKCNNRRLWVVTEVRKGSSPGVAEEIAILVRFRKKGLFGKWYNYGSTTYLKFEPDGREYSIKDKNSTHEYLWARIFQNGQPVPFQGLCSVKFQGFGSECGDTKYFFRVDL